MNIWNILVLLVIFTQGCSHNASDVEVVYKSLDSASHKKFNDKSDKKNRSIENVSLDRAKGDHSVHLVRKAENYYGIARIYGLNPRDVMELNNHKPLKIGDSILLQKDGVRSSLPKEQKIVNWKNESVNQLQLVGKLDKKCGDIFLLPVKQKRVLTQFGEIGSSGVKQDGIILGLSYEEVAKVAAIGEVAYIGNGFSDYNNIVIVKHKDNYFSIYGYLKDIKVQKGQVLSKGASIGTVNTKLYFAIRKGKVPINPLHCINA